MLAIDTRAPAPAHETDEDGQAEGSVDDAHRVVRPLHGRRVLVIDDVASVRRIARRAFERAGAVVDEAEDGPVGLSIVEHRSTESAEDAAQQTFDAVLVDLQMPRMDGFEVVRRLRGQAASLDASIVMLTGAHSGPLQWEAVDAGADDFLAKPFNGPALARRVADLVDARALRRRQGEQLSTLRMFVPPPTARLTTAAHGAGRVTATVLFSDLRGFTSLSEVTDPARLFDATNEVLGKQSDIIEVCGGYVDKYSGDGLLAVFTGDDAPYEACAAAMAIFDAADIGGLPPWDPWPVGIGIHMGPVLRGVMGGARRRDFTVLGSTVNIAARLCGIAGQQTALVSEEVHRVVGDAFPFGIPSSAILKGIDRPFLFRPLVR